MIPSYDDLTPGIPDVLDSESVDQLALFLHEDLRRRNPPASGPQRSGTPASLYACLRHTAGDEPPMADGEPPAANSRVQTLVSIARDFSPRIMRVSDQEVVLDVSGLGALIGEPPVIATELARALREAGADATVAIAPTQTMARLAACRPPRSPIW